MIEIVSFKRKNKLVEIGYRQGVAVVYAAVNGDLSDDEAKQKGYERVKAALEYEQTQEGPSFTISDNVDAEGNVIEFERFTPEAPKVKQIRIQGDKIIHFTDESPSKIINFTAVALDQYGAEIDTPLEWTGAENGRLEVNNINETYEVTVNFENIAKTITVTVHAYENSELSGEEITMLKAQNKALSERADFVEDIIAEMAMKVYQ